MSDTGSIQIQGLARFQRDLKRADKETQRELRLSLKREVADPIAQRMKSDVPVRSGDWKKTIRAGATMRGAHIVWGRDKVPYAGWREFGGGIPNQQNRGSRPPFIELEFRPEGRFIWPKVPEARERGAEAALEVIDRFMNKSRIDKR